VLGSRQAGKDKKIRHCFFKADKSKMVDCVSIKKNILDFQGLSSSWNSFRNCDGVRMGALPQDFSARR
jgi:hypothetical protein